MNTAKTEAVLIRAGRVVARTTTAARAGDVVNYGWARCAGGSAIHEVGTAKVSRARKYLLDNDLMLSLDDKEAFVNNGGGAPI